MPKGIHLAHDLYIKHNMHFPNDYNSEEPFLTPPAVHCVVSLENLSTDNRMLQHGDVSIKFDIVQSELTVAHTHFTFRIVITSCQLVINLWIYFCYI
ncbi:hypothetical protein GDO81_000941 [Engystomops pustulosus]|uniref:Uncharacterized protein n=1 Tax=Engystomops pustulosus TaxID=76066 RepID=A0AAV7D977_ENGPU|nr:hypothetical protein GDO81_000941 [Engystomops pustulosus]